MVIIIIITLIIIIQDIICKVILEVDTATSVSVDFVYEVLVKFNIYISPHTLPPDTFHDSGTSGHEPDSLEAIHTLVGRGPSPQSSARHTRRGNCPGDGTEGDCHDGEEGRGPTTPSSGGRGVSEAGVLLHLERCAHR